MGIKFPISATIDTLLENFNYALIFMDLGISLSTLQDTSETQNNFSKKIWESSKKGRIALSIMMGMVLIFISIGIFGIYSSNNTGLEQISYGTFVLGIGILGMLKAVIEMYENHKLDKNPKS